ncbi:MAG TPA: aspartyl protease family protein [Bacillota bacterium]|nr:aspartyl protease family protein [Bacillota bacterium]
MKLRQKVSSLSMKKAVLLLTFFVLCSVFSGNMNVWGETQGDELWLKAVQLAEKNKDLVPGKIIQTETYKLNGKVERNKEIALRLSLGEDGKVKTELVKQVENGKELMERKQNNQEQKNKPKNSTNYNIGTADLTIPFHRVIQKEIMLKQQAQIELVNNQKCMVYQYQFKTENGRYSGVAWINESGVPLSIKFTFKPVSDPKYKWIKQVEYIVQYKFEGEDRWYPETGLVDIKGRHGFTNWLSNNELKLGDYWKQPASAEAIFAQTKIISKVNECTIPFNYFSNHIYVKVRINDEEQERVFLLDTGAYSTVIDSDVFQKIGLNKVTTKEINDGFLSRAETVASLDKIKMGDIVAENCGVVAVDLKKIESDGINVDGIIGANCLKLLNLKIDYQKRMLTFFTNPITFTGKEKVFKVKLTQGNTGLIFTSMVFPGVKEPLKVEIDTGSGSVLNIPMRYFKLVQKALECKLVKAQGNITGGVYGESEGQKSRIGKYQLGEYSSEHLPVQFDDRNLDFAILGNDILSRFLVNINYSTNEMILIPNESLQQPSNFYSFGFGIKEDEQGKNRINVIWEGSSAERAGLQIGDEVIKAEADKKVFTTSKEINGLVYQYDLIRLYIKRASGEEESPYLWKEPLLPGVKK